MKKLILTVMSLITALALVSCGSETQPANAEGFGNLEKELKDKFGANAYYTDLTISDIESLGNSISTTVTENPESLKMGEWNLSNAQWNQTSEVTLELPKGTKATDFMFQLGKNVNLTQLGELVEKSIEALKKEKSIEPILSLAFVKFPDDGDLSKAEYVVQLKPNTGGTTFTYSYKLDGTLIGMDY